MPIYSLTKEKIDELNAKHQKMTDEINTLKYKDIGDLLYDNLKEIHSELKELSVVPKLENVDVNKKPKKVANKKPKKVAKKKTNK